MLRSERIKIDSVARDVLSKYETLTNFAQEFLSKFDVKYHSEENFIHYIEKTQGKNTKLIINNITNLFSAPENIPLLENNSAAKTLLVNSADFLNSKSNNLSRRSFLKNIGATLAYTSSGGLGAFSNIVTAEIELGRELDSLLSQMLKDDRVTSRTNWYSLNNKDPWASKLYYKLLSETPSVQFIKQLTLEFKQQRPAISRDWLSTSKPARDAIQAISKKEKTPTTEILSKQLWDLARRKSILKHEVPRVWNSEQLKDIVISEAKPIAEFVSKLPEDLRFNLLTKLEIKKDFTDKTIRENLLEQENFLEETLSDLRSTIRKLERTDRLLNQSEYPYVPKREIEFFREHSQNWDLYKEKVQGIASALVALDKIKDDKLNLLSA